MSAGEDPPPAGPLAAEAVGARPGDAPAPAPLPVPLPIPTVREAIAGAFDLAFGASRWVRMLSVYCGLLVLALAGPAIVEFLALARNAGSVEEALFVSIGPGQPFVVREPTSITMLRLAFFGAIVGAFAVLIEGQILVTAALGAVASGRRIELRALLHLSRRVFWSVLGAALLVGILSRAVEVAIELILRPQSISAAQSVYVIQIVATAIVTAPFAFWMAGIVIGGVGAVESLRRSTQIAARRWRLAVLVAAAGAVLGIIELFALGAGLDLLARVSTAIGLDVLGSTTNGVVATVVTLAGVVAASSLLVTIAALVAAPQVFVFVRTTGYTGGLDRAVAQPVGGAPPNRLVTRPMVVLIGFTTLAAFAGLASIGGS